MGRPRLYANDTERQRAHRQLKRQRALQEGLPAACRQIGDSVTLYLGDARLIAPTLQGVHALIADPPYGVGFQFTKYRRSRHPLQAGIPPARWAANILGDEQPFDPAPWLGYPQVILWGPTTTPPACPIVVRGLVG
jgi:hypothetical protein